jgi:glyoxylase-like metal-dependent hydrolase (beta-lactamase superfamily II)
MEIYPMISTTADSNVYLIKDTKTALIDAGTGMDDCVRKSVEKALEGRELDFIINTHAHYDHCGGNRRFNAKVMIHRDDAKELLSGNLYGTSKFFGDAVPMKFDRLLVGEDKIELGDSILEVIHTPGHTMGSVSLLLKDDKILFSGDTLFTNGGFGRTDLGGDEKMLLNSLERLRDVNFELLYPGHEVIAEDGKQHLDMALEIFRGLI